MSLAPIVYIEDLEDDVMFLRLALRKAAVSNPLIHLPTLNAANEFFDEALKSPRSLALILVDHNLQGCSSEILIESLRNRFPQVPLIEITGSNLLAESEQGSGSTRAFFVKPMDVVGWTALVNKFRDVIENQERVASGSD